MDVNGICRLILCIGRNDQLPLRIILRIEPNPNSGEYRRGQCIGGAARTVGVESQHGIDKPSTHRTGIVITGQAVRSIAKMFGYQLPGQFLRSPCFLGEIGEEVRIGDVRLVGRIIISFIEDFLQPFRKNLCSSHQPGKPLYIVGNEKGIVISTALVETGTRLEVFTLFGIERSEE